MGSLQPYHTYAVKPNVITDAHLTKTNVPETEVAEWDSGTAYSTDDEVQVTTTGVHKVYVAVQANGPSGTSPEDDDGTNWQFKVATNPYRMFDQRGRTFTTNADEIRVEIEPGVLTNALGFIDVEAVRIITLLSVQEGAYTFTGSDTDPLPGTLASVSGEFEIISNHAVATGAAPGGPDYVTISEFGKAAGDITVMWNGGSSTSAGGIVFRYSDTGNFLHAEINNGELRLRKRESSAWSTLGTPYTIAGYSNSQDYELRVIYRVSEIELWLDGVLRDTIEGESFNVSETGVGIRADNTSQTFDDLSIRRLSYDHEQAMTDFGSGSFYEYFFGEIPYKTKYAEVSFPPYTSGKIIVRIINAGGVASIGNLVVGLGSAIGVSLRGSGVGIEDFSYRKEDGFGYIDIQEGDYADTVTLDLRLYREDVASLKRLLTQYRAAPLMIVGSDNYEETIIYGLGDRVNILLANGETADCSLNFKSLI